MAPVVRKETVAWLAIVVARGYGVTKYGVPFGPNGILEGCVRTRNRNRGNNRYHAITLRDEKGVSKAVYTHQLQAFQKYGKRIVGRQVRHLNGDNLDNSRSNIRMGSPSQNQFDRPKESRLRHAKKAAGARRIWKNKDVRRLRNDHKSGVGVLELARREGVSKGVMSMMLNRRTYQDVR